MKNRIELINEVKEYYANIITKNIEIKYDYEIELINLIDEIINTINSIEINMNRQIYVSLLNSIKNMLKHFYDSLFLSNYYISSLFIRMIAENLIVFFVLINNNSETTEYWQYWELLKNRTSMRIVNDNPIPEFKHFEDNLKFALSENDYKIVLKNSYGWAISLGLNKSQCNLKQISLHQSNKILYKVFSEMSDRVHNSSTAQFVNNIDMESSFLFICSEFGLLADALVKELSHFIKSDLIIKKFDKVYYKLLLIIDKNNY